MVRWGALAALAVALLGACDPRPLRPGGDTEVTTGATGGADGADAGSPDAHAADAAGPLVSQPVSVGDYFSCTLRADSSAACWGFNGSGQATPPSDTFTTITAGAAFACGLRPDGQITCWGTNQHGESTPARATSTQPNGATFTQVSAGDDNGCAIGAGGSLACWGAGADWGTPGRIFIQVASGADFACAIDAKNLVACWGRIRGDLYIRLPGAPAIQVSARRRTLCILDQDRRASCLDMDGGSLSEPPDGFFTQVGAGDSFGCGLRDDGRIICWATDSAQPLGAGGQPPDGTFSQISIGATHSCALDTSGRTVCWGDDPIAGRPPLAGTFTDVSVSGSGGIVPEELTHGCAQRSDSSLTCWGYEGAAEARAMAPAGAFRQVSVGLLHSCGTLLPDLGVVCWGDRQSGEEDPPALPFSQIAVGFGFACGVEIGGAAACWGQGWDAAAPSVGTFSGISAGYDTACGIRGDGSLACWGANGAPARSGVPPAGAYQQVSAGAGHSCAIRDGSVACWGGNAWGESSPPAGSTYRQVVVGDAAGGGGSHSCALSSDGRVNCWGDHSFGKCTPPSELFARLAAAENYTCGVSLTGQVWCWGLQARQPP